MKGILSPETTLQEQEWEAEIDRLSGEIHAMLARSQHNVEEAKRINKSNADLIEQLERQLECGKN